MGGYQVPIMIPRWVRLIGSLLGGNDLYGFVRTGTNTLVGVRDLTELFKVDCSSPHFSRRSFEIKLKF